MDSDQTDLIIFHKNLRIKDNESLYYGSLRQNYRCIYIFDPKYWRGNGKSVRQLYFLKDCLLELDCNLKNLNSKLEIFRGDYIEFYKSLAENSNKYNLYFNHTTDINYYNTQYCKFTKIAAERYNVNIFSDFGVQRVETNRDQWAKFWESQMNQKIHDIPMPNKYNKIKKELPTISLETFLKISVDTCEKDFLEIQPGGSEAAENLLSTFFTERCNGYRFKMSNPLDARDHCSRLSPHFAFGTISIRYVYQKLKNELLNSNYRIDLHSFKKRLHWHCHFIQKLETEPNLEFNSMHSMCDTLRSSENSELIERWIIGETGFPFLDACIRHLRKYGWINFRMRAMIMSFASYNLWQPWQKTSPLLAQLFVDYEPGIHISQVQMQSGVTGINLPRIYSVLKQSMDQDPEALFIKKEIPQLKDENLNNIHNAEIKSKYPGKVIDHKLSAAFARKEIWNIRKSEQFKNIAKQVYLKHGSRFRRRIK